MIKNKFLIFIILVLALLSVGVASAEDSSSLNETDVGGEIATVSEVDNSDIGSVEDVDSQLQANVKNFTVLQNEVDQSNEILDLDCDYSYDGTSDFSGITISKDNFTIDGHGHTIDANPGNKQVRIFYITGNNVTLKNLFLINGNIVSGTGVGSSAGGAIWNGGADFTIINSTFTNNKAKAGGVIYSNYTADNSMIINSTFTNNKADHGGVIENYGAAFMISNSNFTDNKASENGGVLNNVFSTNFMISNSAFINNTAKEYGGAIRTSSHCFTSNNNTFINNTATRGTAIFNKATITYSLFTINLINNTYSGITDGSTYIYNECIISTPVTITVLGNRTIKTKAGGEVVLFANIVSEDGASVAGGTLNFLVNGTTQVAASNDNGNYTVSYTAPSVDGKYLVNANYANATIVTTQTGTLNVGELYDVYVDYNNGNNSRDGSSWSDAVQTIGYAMTIVHTGGTIHLADGTHIVSTQVSISKTVTIVGNSTKTLVTNNRNGNGVFYIGATGVSIYNCTFMNSSASSGGVIFNGGATNSLVSNCTFINNSATSKNAEYGGGAIRNSGSGFTVNNCTFINNTAGFEGGAIYNYASGFTVNNCTFIINNALSAGGAISDSRGSDFVINNCIFTNNTSNLGGAVYVFRASNFRINNNTFIDNNAITWGGGIDNYGATLIVCNNTFTNNSANIGMVVYNRGSINLTNNSYSVITNGKTHVYDTSTILSPVIVTVLGNSTVNAKPGQNVVLFATVTTEDGASVVGRPLSFSVGGATVGSNVNGADNGNYTLSYTTSSNEGKYLVGAGYSSAKIVTVETGVLNLVFDYYVDYVNGNDSDTGVNWDHAFKTISHAVSVASEGSSIHLADGTHIVSTQVSINKTVAIVGNSTKALITNNRNGNGVFYINASGVSIYNCTFMNCSAGSGGALYYVGSNSLISNCIFINNSAATGGAVYYNDYAKNSSIKDCIFINNTATSTAKEWGGGAIRNSGADFTVSNCTFINNIAGFEGGAIYNYAANFRVSNCNFINNKAPSVYGGAISDSHGANFIISNCNFTNNTAKMGGAVYAYYASNFRINNSIFTNNTATSGGGVIYNWGAEFIVYNNTFTNSSANRGMVVYNDGTINLTNNTYSPITNGKTHIYDTSTIISPVIVNVLGNRTVNAKPGENVVLFANITTEDGASVVGRPLSFFVGGATAGSNVNGADNGNYTLSYTTSSNEGEYLVSANYTSAKIVTVETGVLNVISGYYVDYVNGNDSDTGVNWDHAFKTISHAVSVASEGYTIYLADGTHIVDAQIAINKTVNIVGNSTKTSITNNGNDKRVFIVAADNVTISNCAFVNNTVCGSGSIYEGGLIYNSGFTGFTLSNCSFMNITAKNVGSTGLSFNGVVIYNTGANFKVSNCSFMNNNRENVSANWNGLIYSKGANCTVSNSSFINNVITPIENPGDGFTVSNCSFINNTIIRSGSGAVCNWGDGFTVSNCSFINNSGSIGGAIINYGGDNFMISNSTFTNNTAYSGGAIYNTNDGGDCTVNNCNFTNNTAEKDGGAITNTWGGNFTVINCNFVNNTATSYGVAISNEYWNCNINLTNNTYSGIVGGKTYIYNKGTILSPVTITVLGNQTVNTKPGKSVVLFAIITTEDGASVSGGTLNFTVNGTTQKAANNANGNYTLSYTAPNIVGNYLVNATYANANNVTVETGVLKIDEISDIYVDYINGNNSRDGSSWSDAVQTIERAMTLVPVGGTIHLADGTHILNNQITIGKKVTIVGNSTKAVITTNGTYGPAFKVTANNVAIYNSSFVNNSVSAGFGAAIYNDASGFTVSGCNFVNNSVDSGYGSAIYNKGSDFTVSNCTFVNNSAAHGGAIYNDASGFTVSGCSFVNNSVAGAGSAIYNDASGTLTLNNNSYSGIGKYDTDIYNSGTILSPVTITVLGNQTIDTQYGEKIVLFANITTEDGASVSGQTLTFNINNTNYTATPSGNGNYSYSNCPVDFVGLKTVNATYNGASNLTVQIATINSSRAAAEVDIIIDESITYGENATIKVNVTKGATGNVTITIDGNKYAIVNLTNSEASLNISGLSGGQHNITVTYNGDTNYDASTNNKTININQIAPTININATDMIYGETGTITVTVNKYLNGTVPGGNVTIIVDGESKNINLENGVAILPVSGLSAGEHKINVTYNGDKNYTTNSNSTSFNVNKTSSKVDVTFNNVVYGENTTVKVNVTPGATGNVTIIIDNKKYDLVNLTNSEATLVVSNLTAGKHSINVTYNGDNNYNKSENTTSFTIAKANPNMEIKVIGDVQSNENIPISVILPGDAAGYVNITVGDKEYLNQAIVNGSVNITIPFLDYGTYNITASYGGDSNYNSSKANSTVFVPKVANYPMNITINPTNPVLWDDVVVYVNLPKNATGEVVITVDGKNYTVNIRDGVANITIANITAGEHTITANYGGDNLYVAKNTTTSFTVNKESSKVNVTVDSVVYGENATVKVNVTPEATGNVTIKVDNTEYGPIAIVDGEVSFDVLGLDAGEHNITVSYNGDSNYNTSSTNKTINIAKATPTININSTKLIYGEDGTITVTIDKYLNGTVPTGNVTISIDGESKNINLENGVAILPVSGLSAGEHTVEVTYNSNNKNYNSTSKSGSINVSKTSSEVNITADSVVYGENVTIKINVTNGATGNVTVCVDGVEYKIIDLINSEASLNISGLSAGEHKINVTYNGDNNHNSSSNDVTVNVNQTTPTITINTADMVYGKEGTITVTVNKYLNGTVPTGNVTIIVDGESKDVDLVNGVASLPVSGLSAGEHTVEVTYNSDNKNYKSASNSTSFNVSKTASKVDVTVDSVVYGENATIKVNVTPGATGNVTIAVDNKKYDPIELNNGEATFAVSNLTAGEHKINVTYNGDNNYNKSEGTISFDVAKANAAMEIKVIGDVQSNYNIPILVILPGDAAGYVNITVGDEEYLNQAVVNGSVNIVIPFLDYGTYNITASYGGDSNYNSSKANSSVFVPKIANYPMNITINPTNPVFGDNVTVVVNLPKNTTGEVVITVDSKNYTVNVIDGVANVTITNVTVGEHSISANYSGDNQYVAKNTTTSFNVDKAPAKVDVVVDSGVYGENTTVKVNVTPGATGNVTITIDGKKYDVVNLDNGEATFIVSNLTAGEHEINVTYNGDNNYKASNTTASVDIAKANATMEIKVIGDVNSTDNIPISVILPGDATGYVNITVGDKEYLNQAIVNGTVNITIDYLYYGTYNITASYGGDSNYNSTKANSTVFVPKVANYPMNITINPTNPGLGDDVVVNVNLPENATGEVVITVDGKNYTVDVVDGVGNITITNITAGEHSISANYSGDNQYVAKNTTAGFNVDKANATLVVKIDDIKVGETINITAALTGINNTKLNGLVNVTINNKTYTIVIVNGTGSKVGDVFNKSANIKYVVNWTGDNNYNPIVTEDSFNVSQVSDYDMNVTVPDTKVDKNTTITVDLPDDATGNVTVTVDGKNYTVPVKNGTANVTIPGLPEGDHNITINYTGDDKYIPASKNDTVSVSKISDFNMTAEVDSGNVGENVTIEVTLPDDAEGDVSIVINGKSYNATVKDGSAVIIVPDLGAGNYTGTVVYSGDDKYTDNTVDVEFKVSKVSDYDMNVTVPDDAKPNENTTIIVDLPDDATGNVTVDVDGKNYTVLVKNGTANVTIPGLPEGDYNITINYTGDDKYEPSTTNKTVIVTSAIKLTADDVVMIYKDGSRLYATLLDSKGNPIANAALSFTINGITYSRITNGSGIASLAINLEYGTYNAVVSYDENNTVNATVTVKSSIIANDLVKMWMNDTQFYATFLDAGAKPLANTNVTFNINGVFYTRTTDANGTAKLNINLRPGSYILTAYNPASGEQRGFNVLVKPLIETGDLTKYYINASSFEAKLWNKDGSIAANKEIRFNINGVFYTRTSDANGIVKLSITLRPGDYIITSIYEGLDIGNNVKVLPTLETSDISMKYGDGTVFKARTLDGQGNPLANQNITYNINGVFYHRTTDSNGIAKLNINLIPGEYIITSYWNDYETGNKIEVL